MSVIYIVFPLALVIAAAAVAAFIWAVRAGQMDDLDTPAMRMLHDDEPISSGSAAAAPSGDDDEQKRSSEK